MGAGGTDRKPTGGSLTGRRNAEGSGRAQRIVRARPAVNGDHGQCSAGWLARWSLRDAVGVRTPPALRRAASGGDGGAFLLDCRAGRAGDLFCLRQHLCCRTARGCGPARVGNACQRVAVPGNCWLANNGSHRGSSARFESCEQQSRRRSRRAIRRRPRCAPCALLEGCASLTAAGAARVTKPALELSLRQTLHTTCAPDCPKMSIKLVYPPS